MPMIIHSRERIILFCLASDMIVGNFLFYVKVFLALYFIIEDGFSYLAFFWEFIF